MDYHSGQRNDGEVPERSINRILLSISEDSGRETESEVENVDHDPVTT